MEITTWKEWIHHWRRRLIVFIAVLGPGLITAVADNDAGGVATYTVAASLFGIASQFLIIPTTLLLAITQEIGSRIAIVTRKGLGDLIREQFGIKIAVFIFAFYFIVNQGVVLQNISGLKASITLLQIPWQWPLILTCAALIASVVRFSYRSLQRVFFLLIFFYISYVVVAIIVKPDWSAVIWETIFPQKISMGINYWFSLIAVLGTTITVWGQFFVSSYVNDKKLAIEQMRYERMEIYLGAFVTNFLSFMIAVAVAQTLFINKIVVFNAAEAALALKPLAGDGAFMLFGAGLFGASLLGLTIVPLATAYAFAELFGLEGSLDTDFKKGRLFYSFFILQIGVALFAALFPQVNLFRITLYIDFLNGAMLPVIFYFLIKFSENKEIMGKYVTGNVTRIMLRVCAVFITAAVIISFTGKIFGIV